MIEEKLFNRDFEMSIGAQKIAIQAHDPLSNRIQPSLRVGFDVEKTGNSDPNRAAVEIHNLNESNRRVLQKGADLAARMNDKGLFYDWPLVIEAGYVKTKSQIFSGDITYADSRQDGTEWVTVIEAEDGGRKYRSASISQSFGMGTPVAAVLKTLAGALGVGLGNSAAHFAAGAELGYLSFANGIVLNGQVSKLLDKYISSAGYSWSIQDGQLQVLSPGEFLMDGQVWLGAATGLVGSPERGEQGAVKACSLLQPTIKPGRLVVIDSRMVKGKYRATKVDHYGDVSGADWYTEFEGVSIQ